MNFMFPNKNTLLKSLCTHEEGVTHFKNGNCYWHTNIKTYKGLIDSFFKDLSLP